MESTLLYRFKENILLQHLFAAGDKLLLAVSGGVDSVVLCELCKRSGYDFIIAHCNFQLRGEESDRDEQFVSDLGKKYGAQVLVKRFDTKSYADKNKLSIQEAARDLRYAWFEEIIGNKQYAIGNGQPSTTHRQLPIANWILTAHHADDNAETVLMNFCRGTGLHGLAGIPVSADSIRRPLLIFSKQELLGFARENKLGYVEDSSNLSSKYTRNYFRNEIIPAISKVYPQVKNNLQDNIDRFKEIEKLYKLSVAEIKKKLCKQKDKEVHILVKQLMGYNNKALIYEIISAYGFSEKQVEEVIKLSHSETGRYIQSANENFRIIRNRHWFIISPAQPEEAGYIIIDETISNMQLAIGNLQISRLPVAHCPLPIANSEACFDLKEIQFPLILRKWKAGDYFYPLGMRKKKKLARFFIDQKLSKTDKENIRVLEMDKKIIWIIGHRIDDRFKVTARTNNVLRISLQS